MLEQKESLGASPNPNSTIAGCKTSGSCPASLESASAWDNCALVSTWPVVSRRLSGAVYGSKLVDKTAGDTNALVFTATSPLIAALKKTLRITNVKRQPLFPTSQS